MSYLTRWFIDNPVAANLLMIFILIAGLLSFKSLRVESFPQLPPSSINIEVYYPGGTAKQIEQGITQRIENAISGIAGIKNIVSQSSAGQSVVTVKKNTGVDINRLTEKVRNAVNSIVAFPEKAERPIIYQNEFGNLAAFVIVHGNVSENVLQQSAIQVQQALKNHQAISHVTNLGKRTQQLKIQPKLNKLKQYNLTVDDVARVIHQWSLETQSGLLKTMNGYTVIRADGFADNISKLSNIAIITTQSGEVLLNELADIKRGYDTDDSIVRFQQENAIALLVSTSTKDNLFDISDAIHSILSQQKPRLPTDIKLDVMADMSPYIDDQLRLLSTNAWQGLLIVLVLLGLFLEIRLAFWVALGIPISIAGTLAFMDVGPLHYSINDITLFGMILVLGILVDDAVVVGESIHSARVKYNSPKKAAIVGVEQVSVATVFGALTTIAAFSPMLWIENELAQTLAGFSTVVILALLFSLIESKFILPTHLTMPKHSSIEHNRLVQAIAKLRSYADQFLQWLSINIYQPSLSFTLNHKIRTFILFASIVFAAYLALAKNAINTVFFPEIPGRYATLKITMELDAPLVLKQQNAKKIEQALAQTNKGLMTEFHLNEQAITQSLISMEDGEIELTAVLSNEALANIPSDTLLAFWRATTGEIEGAYAVNYSQAEQPAGAVGIGISAPDLIVAKQVAEQLKNRLSSFQGVTNIFDDTQSGTKRVKLLLNQRGKALGFTQSQIAQVVAGVFNHTELHRILHQGEELKVLLELNASEKNSIQQLKSAPIQVADGEYVQLGEVVNFSWYQQPDQLYRRNRSQMVTVYWHQNRNIQAPEQVLAQLQQQVIPALKSQYPSVSINAIGEFEEISAVKAGVKKAVILTLLLIYILLAIPLKSYWQPFIIMSVIPFGFAGAIYGHGLMGLPFSLLSMFGLMAMMGVVINDSLVLMTRFNQLVAEKMPIKQALIEAGVSRLRAIFLTTVTTVCGLLPLLAESSEQAQYLKPAAVSLVFGELFATPITLILVPCLLAIFCKAKSLPNSTVIERKHLAVKP